MAYFGVLGRAICGLRNWKSFILLAVATSSTSVWSACEIFRLLGRSAGGLLGRDTLAIRLAMRPNLGSGSRQSGSDVASYTIFSINTPRTKKGVGFYQNFRLDVDGIPIGPLAAGFRIHKTYISPDGLSRRVEDRARGL